MSQLKSEEIQNKIYSIVGYRFSLSSSRQMSRALYGDQKLPVLSKTKTGVGSTSEDALKKLASKGYEVAALILEYRKAVAEEQKAGSAGTTSASAGDASAGSAASSAAPAEPQAAPSAGLQSPAQPAAPAAAEPAAGERATAKGASADDSQEPSDEGWIRDEEEAQQPPQAETAHEDKPNAFTESAISINERSIAEPADAKAQSESSRKSLLIWGIITGAVLAVIILVLLLTASI